MKRSFISQPETPRRHRHHESMSIVIVGSQASPGRRTFLLGSLGTHAQAQPHVRIVHLD